MFNPKAEQDIERYRELRKRSLGSESPQQALLYMADAEFHRAMGMAQAFSLNGNNPLVKRIYLNYMAALLEEASGQEPLEVAKSIYREANKLEDLIVSGLFPDLVI